MQTTEDLQQQLSDAILASESIIACLHSGDFESAKEFDLERANFIRSLSKWRNHDQVWTSFATELQTLSKLNESILSISNKLHDEVLAEIHAERSNRYRHEQYLVNQKL